MTQADNEQTNNVALSHLEAQLADLEAQRQPLAQLLATLLHAPAPDLGDVTAAIAAIQQLEREIEATYAALVTASPAWRRALRCDPHA